jgi:hypothetical protein
MLAVSVVLLNWITTRDHLLRSLGHRHLRPIAGMDLLLLVGGLGSVRGAAPQPTVAGAAGRHA